ncbi:RHS repeat domain-containing protein [Ralstonia solanacearum]|uniref:RHS repeat domain-containing protein n=1 Tax=Ralstonia solanacearum TaxID=305 RepID=UPI000A916320|nr:RHS repeat domain-containing protein [Ralstonia solanacearum]
MREHKLYRAISAAVLLTLSTQVLAQTQVSTTQYAYDTVGNLTQITDPRGLVTTLTYDSLGRRTKVQGPPATPGGAAPTAVFTYDGQDRVRQVTDPRSLVTAYTVDGLGNTTQQQSPDSGTTNATYDAAGNLTSRTDARGKTTSFSYDVVDRLTQASYASGTPTVLEYDGGTSPQPNDIGRLTKVTDEAGSTRFRYNGFGNVVSKTQTTTANGVAKDQTIAYAYGTSGSSTGHVISLTYPGSGNVVGYTYNSAGRIAGLTLTTANGSVALLSNIQYQPFGKPSGWTWGNGTAYTRSFDLSGRLTQFPLGATTGTGTTPNGLSRTVNYDAASRISAYTHTDTSGSTGSSTAIAANQTFGYDDQDRLISYLPANSSQSYSYDANGNRTGQTVGGSSYTQTVDPASNRQTASTGPTPATNSYDAIGNQTGDGTTTYSYSDRGRLASVTKNGTTTNYLYNGLEQRVVKSGTNVPTGATRYVYDEAGHLIGEYDQSGNALQETVYLGDTPVVTLKNGAPYYIYADQIDTPRVITDTNNLMVWRWDQADPFGATLPDENPTSLGTFTYNLRFPGQVYDAETGKHYNVNRDYDPAGGRYVQSDPIGLNGGQPSTYAYVGGSPTANIDPRGLDCVAAAGTVTCNTPIGPINFPQPVGWPATMNASSPNYHAYNVPIALNGADPACVMNGIVNNPTPGSPSPASVGGTYNNATPAVAQSMFDLIDRLGSFGGDPGGRNNSPVLSYSMNGGTAVVNVTLPGHSLFPGYVLRTINGDQVNNYGEGAGALQGPISQALGIAGQINGVWNGQTQGIIGSCGCRRP